MKGGAILEQNYNSVDCDALKSIILRFVCLRQEDPKFKVCFGSTNLQTKK